MQDLWELCHQGEGPALFDMDGTLFAGDLGETSFFVLLAAQLLEKDPEAVSPEDIEALSHAQDCRAADILASYSEAVKCGNMEKAYAITSDYSHLIPYNRILSACHCSFACFGSGCTFRFDGVEHRLFVAEEPHMLSLLHACLQAGRQVYVVSASPLAVVKAFCEWAGLEGLILIAADNGHKLPYGPGKVERLAQAGVLAAHIAFGNSIGDREMLQLARHGVLRNPGDDTVLRTLAQEKAWMVVD